MVRTLPLVAVLAVALAGCSWQPQHDAALHGEASCPVTIANGDSPPGQKPSKLHHGNGALWTALPPNGVLDAGFGEVRPDGSIGVKFGWWRAVSGRLTIEGRRIGADAPPLRAEIPSGYGASGFQASGIVFPTEGCWDVTGRAGDARLTFVVLVVPD